MVCETYDAPGDNIVDVVSFAISAVIPFLPLAAGRFLAFFSDATILEVGSCWSLEGIVELVAEDLLGVGVG